MYFKVEPPVVGAEPILPQHDRFPKAETFVGWFLVILGFKRHATGV